tara:strand:- start:435 stop:674 length:240 start_codon:yes stop_codon:yes gene_type:complete
MVNSYGPLGETNGCPPLEAVGKHFRVLDDDGEVYASGTAYLEEDDTGFEVLDYFTAMYGCTSIQYYEWNPTRGWGWFTL